MKRSLAEWLENESHNIKKKQRTESSLLRLCMRQGVLHLPQYAHKLHLLPNDLSIPLLRAFLGRRPPPSFTELRILCESSWGLENLSSSRVPELNSIQQLNSRGVQQLVLLPHLVRLDFSGCPWLDNLKFLSALNCLECLNLRDCRFLRMKDLLHIRELTKLECLDVENVSSMTNDIAAYTIPALKNLRALNVSGTRVTDWLVEFLTYGSRLHSWAAKQEKARLQDLKLVTETGSYGVHNLMSRYPVSKLICWQLRCSRITKAAIKHLIPIPDLLLLDVRQTKVYGYALFPLKAKHNLDGESELSMLVARSREMRRGIIDEKMCGCRAMGDVYKSSDVKNKDPDELKELWQQAIVQFLQEASRGTSR